MSVTNPALAWPKIKPPEIEFRADRLHSSEFGDSYFQPLGSTGNPNADVLAESRYTFVDGCRLTERWQREAPQQFCVAELGFGSGSNLVACMKALSSNASRPKRLDYLAFESRPLSLEQLRQAQVVHGLDLSPLINALEADCNYPRPGCMRYSIGHNVWLTLVLGEASDTLGWFRDASVDAWFLDGFAPGRSQGLWQADVLAQVGRLSRPGATLASFTAASQVRRDLEAAGFQVEKTPGFGPKRERIIAVRPGEFARPECPPKVSVAGGGIMGCWASHAAHQAGLEVRWHAPQGVLEGPGSSVPVPIVSWRPSLDFGALGQLAWASFQWASSAYARLAPDACRPGPLLGIEQRQLPSLEHWSVNWREVRDSGWRAQHPLYDLVNSWQLDQELLLERFETLASVQAPLEVDHIGPTLWATGHQDPLDLAPIVSIIRGQQSLFPAHGQVPSQAVNVGKILGPQGQGAVFLGSSFDREPSADWQVPRDQDDQEALAHATARLGALPIAGHQPLSQWVGLRAVAKGRWPNYVFLANKGQWSVNALGSHGFTLAPWLAEQWVSDLVGAPNVVPMHILKQLQSS